MPRNTNRYRAASERTDGRRKIQARIRLPRPRRELVIVGVFALAAIVGLGSLGAAAYLAKSDHDWASVATVDGPSISREQLRGRMAVLDLLAQERSAFISREVAIGNLSVAGATALQGRAGATTTLEAARTSLIGDELLRQLAARDGVAAPASPDPWLEATAYASDDEAHRLPYVRFGLPPATSSTSTGATSSSNPTAWPVASPANVAAATARVQAELAANTPVETIVANLHDAGWQVVGENVAVSSDGVPADSSLDLDPTIAADATRGKTGDIVGPTTDAYGRVAMGELLDLPDSTGIARALPDDATKAKVDTSALQSWADGQALRRAVTASLIAGWSSKGVNEAHFRELVVGAAPDSAGTTGPWVELSALVVGRLSGVSPSSFAGAPTGLDLHADALAKTLAAMASTDRTTLFRALVAAANRPPGPETANASGELGFFTKDGLSPELGKSAFGDATRTGDVIGPVTTAAGPELFLVESRCGGTLDERSQVALRQIRNDPAADPLTYTQRYSPAGVALANDAGWRAEPEFGAGEAVRSALFDTAIGTLSDPFVLDGKLALALVTERRTAVPDARTLNRLTLDGYDAWFASEYAKATIARSDNPLPELATPSPSSSASAAPVLPSAPALDTPNLPSIPGFPAATPVPTDALGFPALP